MRKCRYSYKIGRFPLIKMRDVWRDCIESSAEIQTKHSALIKNACNL